MHRAAEFQCQIACSCVVIVVVGPQDSIEPCHLSSRPLHSAFFADTSLPSALAVVCIMDSTPNACADAVGQERLRRRRERERQQRAEETAEDRAQQLVVCAAVLTCSHLLLIVAIGIAHAMPARTMLCIRLVSMKTFFIQE